MIYLKFTVIKVVLYQFRNSGKKEYKKAYYPKKITNAKKEECKKEKIFENEDSAIGRKNPCSTFSLGKFIFYHDFFGDFRTRPFKTTTSYYQ